MAESAYFYSEQYRRYILQFIRAFTHLRVRTEPDENGLSIERKVPTIYGDMSRIVAGLLKDNSENVMNVAPLMSAYITGMEMAPERRADTTLVRKQQVSELEYNKADGYKPGKGNSYTVESYMPVPYYLKMNLDVWTTNTTTKFQLLEQIQVLFNPSIQIQQNQNLLDWTSVFEIELIDITWSNRSIPIGTDASIIDYATLSFKVWCWINPPSKVKKQKIIHNIVTNINSVSNMSASAQAEIFDHSFAKSFSETDTAQVITTYGNYGIEVINNEVSLLTNGVPNGIEWVNILEKYGMIVDNVTTLRLKPDADIEKDEKDVLGTVLINPDDPTKLLFSVDIETLPSNTLPPVNAFIDSSWQTPGNGLPVAAIGQRYIVLSSNTDGEEPAIENALIWSDIIAWEGDIIEFDGAIWNVVRSSADGGADFLANLEDTEQYRWDGQDWVYSYAGNYNPGYWQIHNLCK